MLIGTNMQYTKAHNFRIVLETIRRHGPLSRADVARRSSLTAQTVSNITRKLMKAGLVREADRVQEGRGAPATALTLDAGAAFSIGLDFDKDHLTGVLADFVGHVRQRIHYDLDFPSPDEAVDLLEDTARTLVEREGLDHERVWGVGVGLPGPLGLSKGSVVTNLVNPTAFPGWHDVPVVDLLHERLSLPIFLENNATAAAIGESWYGDGQKIPTFFYVFFGAGLGGGLIIDGHHYDGVTGNAGEVGYFPSLSPAEPVDGTEHPHLGIFFNLPRLYRFLEECGVSVLRPTDLEALLDEEHPALLRWLHEGARHLAPLVLAIEYLFDPEAIFFGGRLPRSLIENLQAQLGDVLPAMRIKGKTSVPSLRLATAGADAAALGLATLPMYSSLSARPRVLLKRDGRESPSSRARRLEDASPPRSR